MRYLSTLTSYAALAACVTLFGAGCAQTPTPTPVPTPTPTSTAPTPASTSTLSLPTYPEVQPVVRVRPAGMVCDTKNFICVPSSLVNSHVQSPVTASGTAIAFESTFQWKLLGPANQQIAQGTLMANAPDIGQPGPFTLSHAVTIPTSYTTGTLRFYEASAKDGSAIHILNIPVTF
jgi:hypothetical protein